MCACSGGGGENANGISNVLSVLVLTSLILLILPSLTRTAGTLCCKCFESLFVGVVLDMQILNFELLQFALLAKHRYFSYKLY